MAKLVGRKLEREVAAGPPEKLLVLAILAVSVAPVLQ